MSQYEDDHEKFLERWAEEDTDCSDDFPCRYCGALVYWGPHVNAVGLFDRRLFTSATAGRLHDCRTKPDPDAFDVVPE